MDVEIISNKQFIAIMVVFLLGGSIVMGVGDDAGRDAWVAVLAAMLIAVPFLFVYARIAWVYPGKGLYEILFDVFGGIAGRIIAIAYLLYAFHLGAIVIRNFTEFIQVASFTETPQYVTAFFIAILSIWIVKAGIEVIGRWVSIVLPIMLTSILIVTILVIPKMEFYSIMPVLYNGFTPVLKSSFAVFSFPFAESVILLALFENIKKEYSPYRMFYAGLFIGGSIVLLVTLRSLFSLGETNVSVLYFPPYSSVRLIKIGEFLERIEVVVVVVFMLGGFLKCSLCLFAAGKGMEKVLGLESYRQIAAPLGLLTMILSVIIYSSNMEMFEWADKYYKYYAMPFQIIFPVLIWIGAEIKARKRVTAQHQ
jgi:spore germination protein KB